MKPYLESVRRLSRVALILLVLSVVANLILSMQFCMNEYLSSIPSFSQMFLPVIVYMFVGGLVLALDGFSFLGKRADSDFYHSLPISRRRLFWAVSLAALTWLATTILLSVLVNVIVYTVTRTPFVPNYALVAVPFCITGGMLVFAAASIALSLTGTLLSNIAMTLVVLGLPRFIQFVISRGILARLSLIGWLDLPWYLTPVTNVATGQIVTFTHNMLQTRLYSMGNVGYSFLLALAELFVACLLFIRRPSELAEHNAKSAKIQTLYACLVVLPIAILFASGAVRPTLANIMIVAAVVIALYAIYQIVVFRNSKKVLRSMPWALVPIALAFAAYFGIQIPVNAVKNDIPMIQDVSYVQFSGTDRASGMIPYDEFLVSQIKFSEQDVKEYVLTSLRENLASLDQYGYVNYRTDGNYATYEPVTIVLRSGREIKRILWFSSMNTLNSLRDENAEYTAAIRTIPSEDTICYLQTVDAYNPKFQDVKPILRAYVSDIQTTGYVPNWVYIQHADTDDYSIEGKQSYGSLYLMGYTGSQRYAENYEIRRETQSAASAWMSWQNSQSTDEYFDVLKQMTERVNSFLSDSDYLNGTFSFYNVPLSNGTKQYTSFYYNRSGGNESEFNTAFESLANELIEIISRSSPTTDPNDLCVFFTWSGRVIDQNGAYIGEDVIQKQMTTSANAVASRSSVPYTSWGNAIFYSSGGNASYYLSDGSVISYNPCYRAFSAADETRVVEILKEWQALQKELQFSYSDSAPDAITIENMGLPEITPTPVPQ